ncbi:MAG: hypothetical protein NC084_13755 [Bacteroides sp.]|nr:hypothetical protein [Eubacterium sp.]MCM1419754.1 hypothetical protein [Roseburia sp.]MCM1463762.1 hypothetical protein [Bacteroides sp.]
MKKLKKTLVSLLTALCLCTGTAVSAEAARPIGGETVMPMYEIANNPTAKLSISGTTATCTSETKSQSAVSITVTHTLQKKSGSSSWSDLPDTTQSKTVSASNIRFTSTESGLASGTYRLKAVFTLKNASGKTETFTIYSDEKSC